MATNEWSLGGAEQAIKSPPHYSVSLLFWSHSVLKVKMSLTRLSCHRHKEINRYGLLNKRPQGIYWFIYVQQWTKTCHKVTFTLRQKRSYSGDVMFIQLSSSFQELPSVQQECHFKALRDL